MIFFLKHSDGQMYKWSSSTLYKYVHAILFIKLNVMGFAQGGHKHLTRWVNRRKSVKVIVRGCDIWGITCNMPNLPMFCMEKTCAAQRIIIKVIDILNAFVLN